MNRVKWVIWLGTTLWESPYGQKKVSLWKWLDLFVVTKSFQNDQNRWEMSELSEMRWNGWIEGNDLEQPYGKVPMVEWRCPYQSDLSKDDLTKHYQMNGIDEIWMNWSEMRWNEVKWVNGWKWLGTLWESPYESVESVPMEVTWCEWKWVSLSKWSESMRFELE